MGPNSFQSSFIPKGSSGGAVEQVFQKKKTSFFGAIMVMIFFLTLLLTLGIYGYKWATAKAIATVQSELKSAEASIDIETIDSMVAFSKKLSAAREVVMRHKVISNFLTLLSDNTIQSVSYDDFNYSLGSDGQLTVVLKGKALDYASIALQDSIFSELKEIKSIKFGDLSLIEGGRVSFSLNVSVDSNSAIYSPPELEAQDIDTEEDISSLDDLDTNLPDLDNL